MFNGYNEYEPELPEYIDQISDIIDTEVERRLAKKVSDINKLRDKQESYNAEIREFNQHIEKLTRELESAKRIAEDAKKKMQSELNRKRTETFKELTNGWHEASEAFMLRQDNRRIKCPVCNGDEKIVRIIDGTEFSTPCPVCKHFCYDGKYAFYEVERLSWYYSTDLMIVKDNDGIVYPAVNRDRYATTKVNLNLCYKTMEDAQAEADLRNKENHAKAEERVRLFIEEKGYNNLLGAKE
ncbi:MAG: hypothetical protein ACI4EU_05085 [Butyrivibrio sp.]